MQIPLPNHKNLNITPSKILNDTFLLRQRRYLTNLLGNGLVSSIKWGFAWIIFCSKLVFTAQKLINIFF